MSGRVQALSCGWSPCGNTTTNPNGFCWAHQNAASLSDMMDHAAASSNMKVRRSSFLGNRMSRITGRRDTPKHEPRDEQVEATEAAIHHFESGGDRCQIRAACGMGKTTMHQMIIDEWDQKVQDERGRCGVYVVVAPTIELAKQLRREYETDGVLDLKDEDGNVIPGSVLSVHHNPDEESTGPGKGWRKGLGKGPIEEDDIRSFLEDTEDNADHPRVVFMVNSSTSLGKFTRVQREMGLQVDMAVFDESHKYAIEMDPSVKRRKSGDEVEGPARIFFNEDEGGLDADRRLFTTATVKGKATSADSCFSEVIATGGRYRDVKERSILNYKKMDAGEAISETVRFSQDDQEVYGPVVSSWSFSHAVEKGYLVQPSFEISTTSVNTKDVDNVILGRNTPIAPNGDIVGAGTSGAIQFSTYQSLNSTMDTLVSPSSSETSSPHRNVLVFSNSSAEIDEFGSSQSMDNWRAVAMANARRALDGANPPSEEQAKEILRSGGASESEVRAAKYVLLAEHAQIAGCHSKMKESDKARAFKFFDKEAPGDNGEQTCETINGWNPCARVVVNHDMFSEGLNIPAVDTVVMNRPKFKADESVYQAIGRSSRNWYGKGGVNHKSTARVIIPSTVMNDGKGGSRWSMAGETAQTLRSISRVWGDRGDSAPNSEGHARDYWMRTTVEDGMVSYVGYGSEYNKNAFAAADEMFGYNDGGPASSMTQDDAYGIRVAYKNLETAASAAYRKDNTGNKSAPDWASLSQKSRYDHIMRVASENSDKPIRKDSAQYAFSLNRRNPSPAEVEQALAMTSDINTRRNRADYVDDHSIAAMERGAYVNKDILHQDGYQHQDNERLRNDVATGRRNGEKMTRTLATMFGFGNKK